MTEGGMLMADEITLGELIQWYSRELSPAPCDCSEVIDGYYCCRCECRNKDDAQNMAIWCAEKNQESKRIATLGYLKQVPDHTKQEPQ